MSTYYQIPEGFRGSLKVSLYCFCLFLFTLPLKGSVALNNISLFGALFAMALAFWRREVQVFPFVFPVLVFAFYSLAVIPGIFINPIDVVGSLKQLKANLLEQWLVFVLSLLYLHNGGRGVRVLLLAALLAGFLALLVFCFFQVGVSLLESEGFKLNQVVPGYGINAQFYIPILLGFSFFICKSLWCKIGGLLCAFLGIVLAIFYDSTSATVLILLYLGYVLYLKFYAWVWRNKIRLVLFLLGVVVLVFFGLADSSRTKIIHQIDLLKKEEYYTLLSYRGAVWDLGFNCQQDVPWYGLGYGQKKINLFCGKPDYIESAKERGNPWPDYFKPAHYGKATLHNQYIENLLVGGWGGSILWLLFFGSVCVTAWRARGKDDLVLVLILPVLIIFLFGCLFNGLWEAYLAGKAVMLFCAFGSVYVGEQKLR